MFLSFTRHFPSSLWKSVALYAAVLMSYSTAKHLLFQSTAFDLGYFDQATYLVSQGEIPVVSFWGYHFMGGHADWIVYALAGLYRLHPTVYWLLGAQAMALASGGLVTWKLARQADLNEQWANTLTTVYLLQPLIFNINLFDFHAEVIAVPCILTAVWAARSGYLGWFTFVTIIALGCRDSLSLNIAVMGIWLMIFEHRRRAGAIALTLGLLWFYLATQWVIPHFRPGGLEAVGRYAEFGDSIPAILASLIQRPQVWILHILTLPNLGYGALLFGPWIWGLKWGRSLLPLLPVLPTIATNLLTTYSAQKDIIHQYSLPIIPFLWLTALAAISQNLSHDGKQSKFSWLQLRQTILIWSILGFLCLSKFHYMGWRYLEHLDTWQASTAAIAQIPPKYSVLTTAKLAPHLTHRKTLKTTDPQQNIIQQMENSEYILLDRRHGDSDLTANTPEMKLKNLDLIIQAAKTDPKRQLISQQDDIYLFGPKEKK